MTLDDVKNQVLVIKASAGDNEIAHAMEDDLYKDVLRTIAEQEGNPLAIEALKAADIEFARWYA